MEAVEKSVPLAEFVQALRAEIKTVQAATDPEVPIELGPVSVEFTVLTRREGEGAAGIKFWVVEAGVTGKHGTESTQKVTMELQPLGPGGHGRARIRDRERG